MYVYNIISKCFKHKSDRSFVLNYVLHRVNLSGNYFGDIWRQLVNLAISSAIKIQSALVINKVYSAQGKYSRLSNTILKDYIHFGVSHSVMTIQEQRINFLLCDICNNSKQCNKFVNNFITLPIDDAYQLSNLFDLSAKRLLEHKRNITDMKFSVMFNGLCL